LFWVPELAGVQLSKGSAALIEKASEAKRVQYRQMDFIAGFIDLF
jgi:hypothetical protein